MSTSNGYSAAYDAVGNMIYRAPTSSTTCNGTQTSQQLSYDPQGRFTSWQNQPNSPTQTANYLYDGSGNRVAMQANIGCTMTTTAYIGSAEEVQTTGGTTQTTTYYTVGGKRIAANVNGTFYYFGYDALGSQVIVLNSSGAIVGSQLYGPYGNQRYSTGTLPTSIGFTGQHADSVTGLDYYNARYYDPAVGQFLSPDWIQGNILGMNPYTYVSGNPETLTDPSGLCGWQSLGDVGDCFTQAGQATEQVFEEAQQITAPLVPLVTSAPWWVVAIGVIVAGVALGLLLGLADLILNPIHGANGDLPQQASGAMGGGKVIPLAPQPTPPGNAAQARSTILQLRQDRPTKRGGRAKLNLSNGDSFILNSHSKADGIAQLSPNYGKQFNSSNGPRSAFCAEARCMQAAEDKYGNSLPVGFNEMWETQKDGKAPCDWAKTDEGGCAPGSNTQLPSGWVQEEPSATNPNVMNFTHEPTNLQMSFDSSTGEAQVDWVDNFSIEEMRGLSDLMDSLGDDVNRLVSYATDGFREEYFSTEAQGLNTLSRLSRIMARMGFNTAT